MENLKSKEFDRLSACEDIFMTEVIVCKVCFNRYIAEHISSQNDDGTLREHAMISALNGEILSTVKCGVWYCPICGNTLYDENI